MFTTQPGKNFICNASDIMHNAVCHHHSSGHNIWTSFGPVMAGPWQDQSWRDQNGHPQVTVILSTDVNGNEWPAIEKLEHEINTLLEAAPARRKSDPYSRFSSLPPSLPRKANMVPSIPPPPPPVMPSALTSSSNVSARVASSPVLPSPDASPQIWLSTPNAPSLGSLASHKAYQPQNGLSGTSTFGILVAICMLGLYLRMNRKRYLRKGMTTVAVADNDADCNAPAQRKGRRARRTRTRHSKQARSAREEAQCEIPDQREPLGAGEARSAPNCQTETFAS